jgi:NTP pyrophosphatase (non-canonical NTP hydrolase)
VRERLAALLSELGTYQRGVSATAVNFEEGSPSPRAFRDAVLGLMVEAGELFNAAKCKPWRLDHPGPMGVTYGREREELLAEFADVLAFLGILVYQLDEAGFTAREVADAYVRKSEENRAKLPSGRGEPVKVRVVEKPRACTVCSGVGRTHVSDPCPGCTPKIVEGPRAGARDLEWC